MKKFKMEDNDVCFYHRPWKLYVFFRVDDQHNQIGPCGYGITREDARSDYEGKMLLEVSTQD
jgi:hypothetical protein